MCRQRQVRISTPFCAHPEQEIFPEQKQCAFPEQGFSVIWARWNAHFLHHQEFPSCWTCFEALSQNTDESNGHVGDQGWGIMKMNMDEDEWRLVSLGIESWWLTWCLMLTWWPITSNKLTLIRGCLSGPVRSSNFCLATRTSSCRPLISGDGVPLQRSLPDSLAFGYHSLRSPCMLALMPTRNTLVELQLARMILVISERRLVKSTRHSFQQDLHVPLSTSCVQIGDTAICVLAHLPWMRRPSVNGFSRLHRIVLWFMIPAPICPITRGVWHPSFPN